ncbi:MFS-type transporter SLC18B1-like [Sycon ciliatum]|uniref:MFS-type transporter SLC18B1-like n=1 Tax=Sycon ciliatum TaxID=27933 RepID=UPI0031F5FE6E
MSEETVLTVSNATDCNVSMQADQKAKLPESDLSDAPTPRKQREVYDGVGAKANTRSPVHCNIILLLVAINNTIVWTAIGLMMPFFGREALNKVPSASFANHFAIGLIISIATLVEFLAAPIFAKDIVNVGSKLMLVMSTFEISAMIFLFSFVGKIESWSIFLAMCLSIRLVQGISTAANFVSSFSLLVGAFPESNGLVNGVLRCANGVGYAIGPALGGVLYDVGGFALPFYVVSGVLGINLVLLVMFLPSIETELSSVKLKSNISYCRLLSIPWVWMVLISIFIGVLIMGFTEPVLAVYLKHAFNLPTLYAGIAYAIQSVTFSGATLPIGYWVDRSLNPRLMQAVGLFICGIGCQLVGPAPFLPLPKSVAFTYLAMVLFGMGWGFTAVSSVPDILRTLDAHGLGSPGEMRAAAAGLFQAAASLGYGVGPMLGSTVTAAVGFEYGTSMLGAVYLLWTVLFSIAAASSDKLLIVQLENLVKGHS